MGGFIAFIVLVFEIVGWRESSTRHHLLQQEHSYGTSVQKDRCYGPLLRPKIHFVNSTALYHLAILLRCRHGTNPYGSESEKSAKRSWAYSIPEWLVDCQIASDRHDDAGRDFDSSQNFKEGETNSCTVFSSLKSHLRYERLNWSPYLQYEESNWSPYLPQHEGGQIAFVFDKVYHSGWRPSVYKQMLDFDSSILFCSTVLYYIPALLNQTDRTAISQE